SDRAAQYFFFSSRRRHTRFSRDWSSDVCSSDLRGELRGAAEQRDRLLVRGLGDHGLASAGGGVREAELGRAAVRLAPGELLRQRSEERRVGKESRAARSPDQ